MKKRMRHVLPVTAALVALALVPLAGAGTAHQSRTGATTVHVKAGEMFFKLSTKTLSKPGRVTFVVTNGGHVLHDFRINRKQTALLQPGKTARLTVTFSKKGRYAYLCTVPGHAAAGMRGVFTVR
jgi:uncharacterized cupredoxin-like copper-binding protein